MVGPTPLPNAQFFRYAFAESSVGRVLVVMSEQGVADIISGDSPKEMLSAALARHPGSGMIPDRGAHAVWVAAVVRRIELPGCGYSIPLDLGTAYGQRAAG